MERNILFFFFFSTKPPNQRIESPSFLFINNPFFLGLQNEAQAQARLEKFQKMDTTNPQSSGICHRLFRLVLGAVRRPFVLPPPPAQVQNGKISSSSEVVVEFRHTGSAKGGLILNDDHNKKLQNGVKRGKEKEKEKEKKSVGISGRERKEVAIESAGEQATMVEDDDDAAKARIHWPLLGVESNINEKSEAFIERKKKAMTRNYSLDQDHNKK